MYSKKKQRNYSFKLIKKVTTFGINNFKQCYKRIAVA